jgi:hypothetical protein
MTTPHSCHTVPITVLNGPLGIRGLGEGALESDLIYHSMPSSTLKAHELSQARRLGQVGKPVLDRLLLSSGPLSEQPGRRQPVPVRAAEADVGRSAAQGTDDSSCTRVCGCT